MYSVDFLEHITTEQYNAISEKSKEYSDSLIDAKIQERALILKECEIKFNIFDNEQNIYNNILKYFRSITQKWWGVAIIICVLFALLGFAVWGTYQVLSTIYNNIYQLLYWSVKYSFVKNVNTQYTLSALFSAFSLYVWISIFGIKKFFGKIFNNVSDKINDKIDNTLDINNKQNN